VRRALTCLVAAAVLSGCGNDRSAPPDPGIVRAPGNFRRGDFPKAGISLLVPSTWLQTTGEGQQVGVFSAGPAQIAIWRYPRTEPLPETRAQLHAARTALIAQVRARDPTFKLTSSRLIRRRGMRAVELLGVGTAQGVQRSIRSLHAYARKVEVVVDALAPVQVFPRVDAQIFRPTLRSTKLTAPRT